MRLLARAVVLLALVVAGLTLTTSVAQACTCANATPAQHLKAADVVFVGDVTGRDPAAGSDEAASASEITFMFNVERVFKGRANAEQSVVAQGVAGFCGLTFGDGDSVLVYAEDESFGDSDPQLVTSLCSGSEATDQVPPLLGAGERPVGFSEVDAAVAPTSNDSPMMMWVVIGVVVAVAGGAVVFVSRRRRPPSNPPTPPTPPTPASV